MSLSVRILIVVGALAALQSTLFADWNRFRGPNGSGIAEDTSPLPESWTTTENVKWKLELPGRGVSSPIIVGDNVFVTAYSGYGMSRDAGQIENLKRHLVCVDRLSGKKKWKVDIDAVQPEDPYSGSGVPSHGYATHTPTSDGERVYVFFGKTGALAFDFNGNQLWQTSVGMKSGRRRWGSAASPVLAGDLVIINASDEAQSLIGIDAKSGEERWRISDSALADVWATPVMHDGMLIVGVQEQVWSVDPATGKKLWSTPGPGDQVNVGPVIGDGIIFVQSSRDGRSVAVAANGASVDQKWTASLQSRYASPIAYQGHIYAVNGDVVSCFNSKTGERVFQGRLPSASAPASPRNRDAGSGRAQRQGRGQSRGGRGGGYPSPVLANGKIYFTKKSGAIHIIAAKPEFEVVGSADMTADTSGFDATPAISDGNIFIRSETTLYCIGD